MSKLTDKNQTTSAANEDIFHIVKVSDTSQTPQGSSYFIKKEDFLQDYLPIDGTAEDSDKLGGLGSGKYLRNDIEGAIAGKLTVGGVVTATNFYGSGYSLTDVEKIAAKGSANGYAPLDGTGMIPSQYLPPNSGTPDLSNYVDKSSDQDDIDGAKEFLGTVAMYGKVGIGNYPYGPNRLGDSTFQVPDMDVQSISFKDDDQNTIAAMFVNSTGTVLSVKGFDDSIMVFSLSSKDAAPTEDAESTIANTISYTDGTSYINDQGVQKYIGASTEIAECFFQVLQTRGGADRIPFWCGHYDGTTYERFYEIDTATGIMTLDNSPKAPDATQNDELATLGQVNLGGTSAARPASPAKYTSYFDETLGYLITFNGTDWVDGLGSTA